LANSRQVLFLCSGNYYRSRYAELYFLARITPETGWSAISRGLRLSPENEGSIFPAVIERLRSLGIPFPPVIRPPRTFALTEVRRAERIIALDENEHRPLVESMLPEFSERIVYWHVPDVEYMPSEHAFLLIERQVDILIRSLVNNNPHSTEKT
jgi:protein-tyrosine phosphatase